MPRLPCLLASALLALASAQGAAAQALTATECAAYWYGRDDYAKRSKVLPRNPADLARAQQAERAAVGAGGDAAAAAIQSQRGDMKLLFEAVVELGDAQSRALQEQTAAGCTALGATLP